LAEHVCGFSHDSGEFPSWVGEEDGEGSDGLGGVGNCGFGPNWGFNDGAGAILEVLSEFGLELGRGWEVTVGVAVDGDVLEGNPHLSFVGDEGENVFPEGA